MMNNMKKIKVLIVDDHKMVRNGIRTMLETPDKKYKFLLQETENAEEGIEKAKKGMFDVIIMDYQLPRCNGADATRMILTSNPEAKVLALSSYDEYMYIDNMLKANAKGYVLKNISRDELIHAIETIMSGGVYYSNEVALKLISFENSNDAKKKSSRLDEEKEGILSKREIEILKLIAEEYTNEEIANKLFISKRTVDTHRQNLLNKLNVKNTAGLVKCAIDLKLLV